MNLSGSGNINKKKSAIWDHYTITTNDKAQCKICKNLLSFKTSTTNLRKHYDHKHHTVKIGSTATNKNNNSSNINESQQHVFFSIKFCIS